MPNQQIYLLEKNGKYAKLDIESMVLAETSFAVSDIADISTRKDTFTQNITLKGTKNNNRILGNIFNLNRVHDDLVVSEELFFNFNQNKGVDCLLFENDTLISKGIFNCSVTNIKGSDITYDCIINGYTVNFFAKLKDKLLSDLDFTSFNHTYSISNIVNSWSNTTGYVYPLAEYGNSSEVTGDSDSINKFDYKDFRPAFYLTEYIDRIFKQPELSDYTYSITGSTSFTNMFKKLVVPNNADVLANFINGGKIIYGSKNNEQKFGGDSEQMDFDNVANKTTYKSQISWANFTDSKNFLIPNSGQYFGYTNNVFTSTRNLTTTFDTAIRVNFETFFIRNNHIGDILNYDAKVCIIQRDSPEQEWSITASGEAERINTNGVNWNAQRLLKLKGSVTIPAGGQIAVIVFCDQYYKESESGFFPTQERLGYFRYLTNDSFIQFGDDLSTSKYELALDDLIDFKNNQSLNTFKQQDFIKSILNMFNLYVYSSTENPKHIIFEPFNDFYSKFQPSNLVANAINWTKKIDFEGWSIKRYNQIFKNYSFTMKDDSDWLNTAYKNKYGSVYGSYTYANKTSVTADSKVELIFAPTPITTIKNRNLPQFFTLESDGKKTAKQTQLRILFYNGLKSGTQWHLGTWNHLNNTFNTLGTYQQYPEIHTLNESFNLDLNFGEPNEAYYTVIPNYNTIYEAFYADQIAEYNDSNVQIVDFKADLNEIDVSNLDFKTPIFIDSPYGSSYFKLLSVEYGYSGGEKSSVSLQKIYINDGQVGKTYYNTTISKYVSNPNCTFSESTFISVPAGKYSSLISQVDADDRALAELNHMESAIIQNGACINTTNVFALAYASNSPDACGLAPDGNEYYTSTGNLLMFSILFRKVGNDYIRVPLGYYSDGSNYVLVNQEARINVTGSCSTASYNSFVLAENSSKNSSCNSANLGMSLGTYFTENYIDVGFNLYTDSSGTSPAPNGFYSDGFFSYQVSSGSIINKYNC